MITPPRSRRTRVLLAFILSIVLYMLLRHSQHSDSPWSWNYKGLTKQKATARSIEHPIKQLHEEGLQRFQALVDSQSKTLQQAIDEYQRRYKRSPPQGFDKWYEYATFKNSPIIDDFDMVMETLQPWESIPPNVIVRLFERAASGPALYTFGVKDGRFITADENWQGTMIRDLLGNVAEQLPDFELLMNPLDEPRVLLTTRGDTEIIHWLDESKVNAWDRTEGPCRYRKPGQGPRLPPLSEVVTEGLPFVTDRWNFLDICKNPDFETQHGFLIGPYSFFVTNSPVPVTSQAKPSTFSDILIPSMWYYNHNIENLDTLDKAWDDKARSLYWAGSTTGGVMRDQPNSDGSLMLSQRLRFIRATKQLGEQVYSYLTQQPETGFWEKTTSNTLQTDMYNTKFTSVVQCEGEHCDHAELDYQVGEKDDESQAFSHRFLMDLDGNSFSGRFYNFLASNSCPLKQTIFREWHDERLIPWVHYIPISVSLEDLPEAMRYLATTEEGGQVARKVAEMGKEWHSRALRREDAAVYLYRLFLEFARLVDPQRQL